MSPKWVPVIALVVSFMTLLFAIGGGVYAYGSLNRHVIDLADLEHRAEKRLLSVENKVDTIGERTARIEGYLQKGNSLGMADLK